MIFVQIISYSHHIDTCTSLNGCNSLAGQGLCIYQDKCKCNPGWLGPDCSIPDCSPLNNCTNHGVCSSPYNCTCFGGWSNGDCSVPDCSTLGYCNIAGGGGRCTGPNTCTCEDGWLAPNCSICKYFLLNMAIDLFRNTPTFLTYNMILSFLFRTYLYYLAYCDTPCRTNTTCTAPNSCTCSPGYLPPLCNTRASCQTLHECSGHGVCVEENQCRCDSGWDLLSLDCSIPSCDRVNNCSNNGLCISPQKCECFGNWIGADCGGFDIGETETNPLGNDQENTNKGGSNRNVAVIAGVVPVVIVLIAVAVVVAVFLARR